MTHADLVSRAVRWLRNTRGCKLICTRQLLIADEQPDCIGWKMGGASVLIECKTSRSDFRADLLKPSRITPAAGMGNERFYFTRGSLINPNHVPAPWGLAECWLHRVVIRKAPMWVTDKNVHEELKHAIAMAVRGAEPFEIQLAAGCLVDAGL